MSASVLVTSKVYTERRRSTVETLSTNIALHKIISTALHKTISTALDLTVNLLVTSSAVETLSIHFALHETISTALDLTNVLITTLRFVSMYVLVTSKVYTERRRSTVETLSIHFALHETISTALDLTNVLITTLRFVSKCPCHVESLYRAETKYSRDA